LHACGEGADNSSVIKPTVLSLLAVLTQAGVAADKPWPGLPPDCWSEARLVHEGHTDEDDPWRQNTTITFVKAAEPAPGVFSPNKGYFFVVEDNGASARVIVYAEKDHLIQFAFSKLKGLSAVRWVNEKLLFMRAWWGRIMGTDFIYDVERERMVYTETVVDGYLALQQYRESCPLLGCECIKKK
jgi:hypothetical protein